MVLIRVRVTDEITDVLIETAVWCGKLEGCSVFVCCEEISKKGKKHFHLIAEYGKSVSTFNRLFSNQFPQLVGNKCKSISEGIESKDINIRYVCKGASHDQNPKVLLSNISFDDIHKFHQEFWANNSSYQLSKKITILGQINDSIAEKKHKKTLTFMEKIKIEFTDSYLTQVHIDGSLTVGRKFSYNKTDITFITKFVLRKLGNSVKILDQYIVKRMVLGLLNAVTNEVDDDTLAQHLINQMFPEL